MNKFSGTLISLLISVGSASVAQEPVLLNYHWDETPAYQKDSADTARKAVVLKLNRYYEFHYADESQQNLEGYFVFHRVVAVNHEEAIEKFNTAAIHVADLDDLIRVKARTLTSGGRVVETGREALKQLKDEDGNISNIMAIEGVEAGSIIDFYYIIKRPYNAFGRDFFQSDYLIREANFQLILPENLEFDYKVYHCGGEVTDTIKDQRRYATWSMNDIQTVEEEDYSFLSTKLCRIEYKLAYNTYKGDKRLYTYSDAAQQVFANIYNYNTPADEKAADKYFKKLKLKDDLSLDQKIMAIEKAVKNDFAVDERGYYDIASVISNRVGSETGITRLTAALLKRADAPNQLIVTSDRSEDYLDPEFDTWLHLDQFLFYFPHSGKYLAPAQAGYYYGIVPAMYTAQHGLFIRTVSLGDIQTGMGEVKFIEPLPAEVNFDNFNINIEFDQDPRNTSVNISRRMGGYNSAVYMHIYPLIPDAEKEKLTRQIMQYVAKDAEFDTIYTTNQKFGISPLELPFEVVADFQTNSLVEKAGDKYLFKLGTVIGSQHEMYQDKERMTDVEMAFNHVYKRTIRFTVPDGYVLKNPEAMEMKVTTSEEDQEVFGFVSSYKKFDNTYEVTVDEFYKKINFPRERFEDFRKVVNAAADFNKVVLVLEKTP